MTVTAKPDRAGHVKRPTIHATVELAPQAPARSVDEAIARTHGFLRQHETPPGYWWAELESNPTMEAEYVMLRHILGVPDAARNAKIARYIERRQLPTGGWNMYYGGGADLSTSVECYTALKMAGRDPEAEPMRRARRVIIEKGGVEKTRVFTKIWLAMIGQWEWKGVPMLVPELMLIPSGLPFNIYEFASWTRATVVPMTILLSERPTWPLPPGQEVDELYVNGRDKADYRLPSPRGIGWERILYTADRLLRLTGRLPWNPLRRWAMSEAEKWIVEHQEADGSWGGIQPPWVYSLIALHHRGRPVESGVVKKGLDGFEGFALEDDDTWRLQACVSPVWDTCLALNALIESGLPASDPMAVRATDWLIEQQIRTPGDWKVKVKDAEPGGWAFEFDNQLYPDTDDAAEILMAVGRAQSSDPSVQTEAVERGMNWVLSMQSRNGGWGSFDKDNMSRIAAKLPFFDFGETIDPPSVDVTAHIVEAIGRLGWADRAPGLQKAVDYIWREQESDGPWFGRWGVNYIYGTGAVLPALEAIGWNMSDNRVQKAADWIESRQNPDGGWGETCASYANPALRGTGESTASQTAWALISLISAGRGDGEAAKMGIEYLLRTQSTDGSWEEPQYTATGFPGYGIGDRRFKNPEGGDTELLPDELPSGFMIKYHMYRVYWPLLALGRYRASMSGGGTASNPATRPSHSRETQLADLKGS